ncbi:2-succinylbenzoate--CoA ligase [Oculatella sp. LEGE 06141]|uniref:2-succinylbenzoate--CoA ligase n=1 Tax=Oculatella sp. LEGE 06141 TaxID=1828648 RepID=UPI001881CF94|nr:2-succinylbenzoate--CoA ligase [Oculatella sp. LEGE 06141]MBE9177247.1 2-succinylbenzoate--CoA ligase [Oculatella sp. LEGE 06141]
MAEPLSQVWQRANENWLVGHDSRQFAELAAQRLQELNRATARSLPTLLLVEPEPLTFLASFSAACCAGCPVFLGNPTWGSVEWQAVLDVVQPDLIWGARSPWLPDGAAQVAAKPLPSPPARGWIMIPTGGSSGQIRFAIHTLETLMAAVQGFQSYFQVKQIDSCCVLPMYHVSGLMQFLRSLLSGGRLAVVPFKSIEAGMLPELDPASYFLSLVPTQLQRLLQSVDLRTWLAQFQTVMLGGAPAWSELLDWARQHSIRLAPTYGMTETAAQIATLKPEAFLQGQTGCGQVLPHAQVTIQDTRHRLLLPNCPGRITIRATSLMLGYYPVTVAPSDRFQPEDMGVLDDNGNLTVLGRCNTTIISGGENVFPAEVEAVIRATRLVLDVCVVGLADRTWGEAVVAVYVPDGSHVLPSDLRSAIAEKLSKYKQPKHWIALDCLPRNAQGKINLPQLRAIAMQVLQQAEQNR